MVVGAGRGPLVDASFRAAKSSGRMIRVYAVEKNPGAVNTYIFLCESYRHMYVLTDLISVFRTVSLRSGVTVLLSSLVT